MKHLSVFLPNGEHFKNYEEGAKDPSLGTIESIRSVWDETRRDAAGYVISYTNGNICRLDGGLCFYLTEITKT